MSNHDGSPKKSRLPRFLRRRWFWITFAVIGLLTAVILISLPYGIDYYTEQWFMSHGLDQATVRDVDFNPFTGTLVLHNLRARLGETQVLNVPEARMRFSWRPLLRKRARIENLTIKDTTIVVEHEKKGSWRIGGLALALAKTVTDKPGEPAWGFGLNQVEILNSQVVHVGDGPRVKVSVDRATMSRLRTWDSEQAAHMDFEGKINDGALKMAADFFLFAPQPRISGTLELTALSLPDIVELAPPYLRGLHGELSIHSKLTLKKEDAGIRVSHRGNISLKQLEKELQGAGPAAHSQDKGLYVEVGEIVWEGELNYSKQNQSDPLQLAGDVEISGLRVADDSRKLNMLAMERLSLENVSAQGHDHITVPVAHFDYLRLIQRIQNDHKGSDTPALFSAARVEFENIGLVKLREISMDTVKLSGISSLICRDAQGEWQLLDELSRPRKEDKQSEADKSRPPVVLRIGKASFGDDGEIRFEDRSVSPPFEVTVKVTQASLEDLDSGQSEKPSPLNLVGKIEKYADVSIQGEITRFTQRPSLELAAKIDDLDLPLLSGYAVELIGYTVKSGHLDADIEVRSVEGELDGKTVLSIRNAEVSPADEEAIERFERQLRVPLPTALAVLSDSNKAIALKVPISGDVTDPTFDFSDAFQQALVKGMTKAATTYLKYLFQPYGTMMTVVELGIMAGKKITALRLDPVFFGPGSAELSTEAVTYVERVAKLMKTRPQIRIRLCGLATAADTGIKNEPSTKKEPVQPTKPEEVPETSKTEPFPEKVQPLSGDQGQLRELVRERSERIKEYLVKNYGIEDDRLLVCQPEYDPREDAKPRVELLI